MDLILHPRPLAGTVAAIPSKSWAHRLLLGAALSGEPTLLSCGPLSRDIQATMSCLSAHTDLKTSVCHCNIFN